MKPGFLSHLLSIYAITSVHATIFCLPQACGTLPGGNLYQPHPLGRDRQPGRHHTPFANIPSPCCGISRGRNRAFRDLLFALGQPNIHSERKAAPAYYIQLAGGNGDCRAKGIILVGPNCPLSASKQDARLLKRGPATAIDRLKHCRKRNWP